MQEQLIKVWKTFKTKQLAKIFADYMKNIGVKPYNFKMGSACNTYLTDGRSTSWNRVQCYYNKESSRFGGENLLLVLRKEAGNYLIVERKGIRAFEVDYSGVKHYDEKLLNEIIEDHKPLFDTLFSLAN